MSWFKNKITGGNFNKLQSEEREFHILADKFTLLQESYIALSQSHLKASQLLKTERKEAVRNLTLTKNMILKVKSIANDKKQIIQSDFISYFESTSVEFKIGDVSIDFQGEFDKVGIVVVDSLSGLFKRLGKNKTYTKRDFTKELSGIASDILGVAFGAFLNLNEDVNKTRRIIADKSIELKDAMLMMTSQTPQIYIESKRMIELARVLNMHNQVFSIKYETIQKEINKKSKFDIFTNELFKKKIIPDETMQINLHSLVKHSSEYSRFNESAKI